MGNLDTIVERYRKVLEVGEPIESERVFVETALAFYNSDCLNSEIDNSKNIILLRLIYPELLAHKIISVRPEMILKDTDKRKLSVDLPKEIVDILGISEVEDKDIIDKEHIAILMKIISDQMISELNTRLIHHMIRNSITHKQLSNIDGVDLHEVNLVGETMEPDFIICNTKVADTLIDKYEDFKLETNFSIKHGTNFIGKVDLPCGLLDVYENSFAPSDFILLGKHNGMVYRPHIVCNIEGNKLYSYDLVEEHEDKNYYHYFKISS